MGILLTGIDGYMGWPLALKLSEAFSEERILGVDNFGRRRWVTECGSVSITPIRSMRERIEAARRNGFENISFIEGDLMERAFVERLIKIHKPEVVIHLAAQPSAPYSQISWERAHYTQKNNTLSTLNLLWALRESGLTDSHFIETTTTGIYGAPNIEIGEGFIEVVDSKGNRDVLPYPNMASSWYHISKGFDAANMQLMNMQTGMPVTDIRTSIVYGLETEETKLDEALCTRFDIDFYFGTLFNRWCAMAVIGHPLTVYGSGNQIKPFISLEDAVESIVNIVKAGNDGEYKVYNQLVEYVRIKDMAEELNRAAGKILEREPGVEYIPNPRKEKEESEYAFKNEGFLKMLGKPKRPSMKDEFSGVLEILSKYSETINRFKDVLLPKR